MPAVTWLPICPACRAPKPGTAFPGNEHGPIDPQENPFALDQHCWRCGKLIPIGPETRWYLER